MSRSSQQLQINCTSRNPWSKAFTQHAPVVHACPRAASTLVSARLSLAAAAVKAELQDQHTHQHIQQQWQQAFPVVSSKRQLLVFGCACCLSLQAQQQLPAAADSGQFTYAGAKGPTHWPGTCSSGTQQSPVDLTLHDSPCDSRPSPAFRYQTNNNVTVKNTGTTLQVNFEPGSNHISWAGQQLELLQYHFHTPSEHTVEGVCSSMEAHLVHKNKTTGGFTVLAVLLEAPPSSQQQPEANPCLAAGQATVPSMPGQSATCSTPVNPGDLLPTGPSLERYVAYRGSLTTPPCSEGVDWLVWTQPLLVPQQQVQQFQAFAGMNSRPVQPLNERAVAANCITAM